MLEFLLAHIPWNAISNLELQPSSESLRIDIVVLSAATLSNSHLREYAPTVDAIMKQLLSWNEANLAWEGWTSTNKVAITMVITYYVDCNWTLCEVQLAFSEVDRLTYFGFES
jgi:hypothetical protein